MKNRKSIPINSNNTEKFLFLALHIVAMHDDAYLSDHPEWHEIVNEANEALISENITYPERKHLQIKRLLN